MAILLRKPSVAQDLDPSFGAIACSEAMDRSVCCASSFGSVPNIENYAMLAEELVDWHGWDHSFSYHTIGLYLTQMGWMGPIRRDFPTVREVFFQLRELLQREPKKETSQKGKRIFRHRRGFRC